MKNKRSTRVGKFNARMTMFVIIVAMIISMVFSTPSVASGESKGESIQDAVRSNFFLNLIGSTVSALKPEKNSDDTSFIGQFSINALNIVNKEVSFLTNDNLDVDNSQVQEQAQAVDSIIINPFKLNDGSINRVENEEAVDIMGDPLDNAKRRILIYHTHTNEAYVEGNTGLDSTVCGVGDVLAAELEKLGFTVIHDRTVHDVADYDNAYYASRETLTNYLNSYGDFDLIIDLHRDAVPNKANITTTIDGKSVAKLMFVTAEQNPRYPAQLEKIESIVGIAKELYPDLFRTKYIYPYLSGIAYYSQDLSDNAVLIEVGANSNNLQEAKNSMEYLSKVLATYLNSK